MISFKTFEEQLVKIQTADRQLHDAITQSFEKNPFLSEQDSSAFPAEWVYKITEDHLRTLFLAVNEKSLLKPVIQDWDRAVKNYEEKVEELRKAGMDMFIQKPDKKLCEQLVVDNEIEYYYGEQGFGGEVEHNHQKYNLANPEHLYNYLKAL